MKLRRAIIKSHRSIDFLDIRLGPFTILFGKNNAGKTNLLEALFGVLAPNRMADPHIEISKRAVGIRAASNSDLTRRAGAAYFQLEDGVSLDDEIRVLRHECKAPESPDFPALPDGQVAFVSDQWGDDPGLMFVDPEPYFSWVSEMECGGYEFDIDAWIAKREHCVGFRVTGPNPKPVLLDWEFVDGEDRVAAELAKVCLSVQDPEGGFFVNPAAPIMWLEPLQTGDAIPAWRLNPVILERMQKFGQLATDLLPDFLDGSIAAKIRFPSQDWRVGPKIVLDFRDPRNPDNPEGLIEDYDLAEMWDDRVGHELFGYGRGTLRWISVAAQLALQIMTDCPSVSTMRDANQGSFARHVLLLDEPEAHLHPSAVGSIVRWCERMVSYGFNVVAATHHDEFLRASKRDATFVHVTRNPDKWTTNARTLLSAATPFLQDLAVEIGMHPASVLSLHRAILFVEGPLDVAVLDEFAGPALDAAGVTLMPIHGTRNLQGLVDSELTTRLGLKMGVLTDATDPATMGERSNSKRSGEEVKVGRLVKMFHERGLPPPKSFGVPEADLLFAMPAEAIRDVVIKGEFPGWNELVAECRQSGSKGPSDSVNWKAYALDRYGLDLTTVNGVRSVVHKLNFANVPLSSIQAVVDQIIEWANDSA